MSKCEHVNTSTRARPRGSATTGGSGGVKQSIQACHTSSTYRYATVGDSREFTLHTYRRKMEIVGEYACEVIVPFYKKTLCDISVINLYLNQIVKDY